MGPHYSQSSRDNATPSSRTSPLASYKEVPPPPPPVLARSAILCKDYGLETGNNPCVSVWHMIHFGGHFTLSSQRGQEFATMNFNRTAIQLFTTHRVWYEFNIFLTSDYKKRWWDLYITPSTEYWNCKLKLKVEIESLFWLFNWHVVV